VARLYRRNGWWHARAWRGGVEYRERLGTKDRSVAEGAFRDWLDKIDRQSKGQAARKPFTEAAVRFIDEHLTTVRATTAKRYGAMLKNLSAHLGGMFLDEITEATLSDYELRRRRAGIAVPTILLEFRCLSSLLSSCKHWGWISANIVPPYLNARSRRGLKPGPPRTRYLTEDEERRLLEDGEPSREMRAAIILAIDTGLRSEELYSLQHEQIDLERGVIRTTTNTKSGRARVVPLPPRSRAAIASLPRYNGVPYVIVNPETRQRYANNQRFRFAAMAARAKIDNLEFHDLRRTAGCRWLQRDGRQMGEVSTLLGHSSIGVTERHYAFFEAEKIAVALSAETGTKTGTKKSQYR
jgi:integrase